MTERQDYSLRYLVALYKLHRETQLNFSSIAQLQEHYDLPQDTYLEGELPDFLESRGWVRVERSKDPSRNWPLQLLMLGKEAAESQIQNGLSVQSANSGQVDADIGLIPASDRIVKLNDNEIAEFETDVNEVIDSVERSNGDSDEVGFRVRILGQLKAGRELIRVGEYRAYLLYEVLIRALVELIDKYSNPTIKALANALLGALVAKALESH